MLHHFILTRFNLPLWKYDKNNRLINHSVWLNERLGLFETYCLPSVVKQSNKNFIWILLCDENTPVEYRDRIRAYKNKCPQIELIQVEEEYAWQFPRIFFEVVAEFLEARGAKDGDICLTTQLDNDDALQKDYVQIVQNHVSKIINSNISYLNNTTPVFFSFDYGVQYFTEMNMATRIKYPNNHFMTCMEVIEGTELSQGEENFPIKGLTLLENIRTCFGYGSHFLLEKECGVKVHHINDMVHPMWCEVIHKDNVDNDVKMTFDTEIIKNKDILCDDYGINFVLQSNVVLFVKRSFIQILRRIKEKFIKRNWR